MLRWLVVGKAELDRVPSELDGTLSVLTNADEPRAAAIEAKQVVPGAKAAYCEVPIQALDDVKRAGCFAKIRTGGVTPETIPSVEGVAAFILACADHRLPFKATAGLHHPVRAMQPLTYEASPPRALMHGFLNVFLAATFAWHGQRAIEPVLAEMDPSVFRFGERAGGVTGRSINRKSAMPFAHSFGSCCLKSLFETEALDFYDRRYSRSFANELGRIGKRTATSRFRTCPWASFASVAKPRADRCRDRRFHPRCRPVGHRRVAQRYLALSETQRRDLREFQKLLEPARSAATYEQAL